MIDWHAQWITADPPPATLPIFRRPFSVDKPLAKALIHLCGLGHFELRLNGQKIGKNVLDPGWTNYKKTCLYVTHDLLPLIQPGKNALGVMLGNGMYSVIGSPGRYKKFKASFGPLKLIAQLHLHFQDGSTQLLLTDTTWKFAPSPITFSCIFGGEDYDARLEQLHWDTPDFNDTPWQTAAITTGPGGILLPQTAPPLHIAATFSPRWKNGVYDLGRNFSGWPEITVSGSPGSCVKLITGERLDQNGRVSQKSSGSPVWFSYTVGDTDRPQTWSPRFSYTGFRYVQVEGDAKVSALSGRFIHSSANVVGHFSCSDLLFNQIHALINAAILSNMQSVLTDCPHREKLGWLEQSHLMGQAIMFNYDVRLLYTKICADIRDAQHEDGCIPTIAPEYTVFKGQWADFSNSPEWGSAAVINPWLLYQQYGDKHALQDNYHTMRRYVHYLHSRAENHILNFGLGDWYDIGPGDPGYSKLTTKGTTATAIYYHDVRILNAAAKILGMPDHFDPQPIANAFNARFFNPQTAQYDRGSQTANALPLALGLVPSQFRNAVLENLIADIRAHHNHVTAGDIGFRFVLDALADAGRSDVIYDLLSRTDPPSYGAQIAQGATTLTEAWDANPSKSQNHLMLGHAELWFYQSLAGIRVDFSQPPPRQITISPQIVGDITWAQARYNSAVGTIVSRWEKCDGKLKLSIEIPPDSSATVYLPPSKNAIVVNSGSHVFQSDVK